MLIPVGRQSAGFRQGRVAVAAFTAYPASFSVHPVFVRRDRIMTISPRINPIRFSVMVAVLAAQELFPKNKNPDKRDQDHRQ